jgi:hypothetical protein
VQLLNTTGHSLTWWRILLLDSFIKTASSSELQDMEGLRAFHRLSGRRKKYKIWESGEDTERETEKET